jgi:hypothetical protein
MAKRADIDIADLADAFVTLDKAHASAAMGWGDPTCRLLDELGQQLVRWFSQYDPDTFSKLTAEIGRRQAKEVS